MNHIVEETRKQVRRYWTEDGLPDLHVGLGFVLYGLLTWQLARGAAGWIAFLQAFFLPVWIVLSYFGIRRVKERLTYPRTGYVSYARPGQRETAIRILAVLGVGGAIALTMLGGLLSGGLPAGETVFAFLSPLLFALVMGYMAWHQSSGRYALYALIALLSGMVANLRLEGLSSIGREATLNGVPLLLTTGAAMLLGGTWTLVRYLRRHPMPEDTP